MFGASTRMTQIAELADGTAGTGSIPLKMALVNCLVSDLRWLRIGSSGIINKQAYMTVLQHYGLRIIGFLQESSSVL